MDKVWNKLLKISIISMIVSGIGIYFVDQHLPATLEPQKMVFVIVLAILFGGGLVFMIAYRMRMATGNKFTFKTLLYTVILIPILFLLVNILK